jgi:hypothetical protein
VLQLNTQQKKIRDSWPAMLWLFAKREWLSLFLSTSAGILLAQLIHLVRQDHAFKHSVATHYKPWVSFDDAQYYPPYLIIVFIVALLALGPFFGMNVWRGLKSWSKGVTSGLVLVPFASALSISLLPAPKSSLRLILGLCFVIAYSLGSFRLFLRGSIDAARTVTEDEFIVPPKVRSLAGSQLEWSDDPIQSWAQDALGRAALVDSLSVKIMIAKTPVILLSGPFGSGKTSTLNLLREHLESKAIVVSFSTWLPGSQETLASYLFGDIARECNKHYLVPGLRQSAKRLATALGQKVPFLSEYLKLLPPNTQKDDINSLKSALLRLPKRVLVLLDEIDRMEKDEIMTLLKAIRGMATLPNVTFVCAGSLDTMVQITGKDHEYFEKFFPFVRSVPEPDPAALHKTGVDRLVAVFASCGWFETSTEADAFKKRIESVWTARIAPFCENLRAIGLLANDVSVAAAPLRGEVDPVDLTLVEMLDRFAPAAYGLVAKNSLALTGGESLVRGGPYQTDEDETKNRTKFLADLKKAVPDEDELEKVKGVLHELFPLLSKGGGQLERRLRRITKDADKENGKRISEPGMFPAYFRYELPDAMFSSTEIASLLQRFEGSESRSEGEAIFLDTLQSMGKGSLKRDDFLRKLAESVKTIPANAGKALGEVAAKASASYTYDMMAPFGEAGHVLRMILFVAQKLSKTERIAFLRQCILNSTDDTMAFRISTILTQQEGDSNLDISIADLNEAFAERMRKRYGRDVDAANFDLSTSDSWALEYWGRNPEDRKIQNEFWLRYIGNSKARLAYAFREFFLPLAAYTVDPTTFVQNRISLDDLKRLYNDLPDDPAMTDSDHKSLKRLGRLLAGEFKNGISPTTDVWS